MRFLEVFFVAAPEVDEGFEGYIQDGREAMGLERLAIGRLVSRMSKTGLLGRHAFGFFVDVAVVLIVRCVCPLIMRAKPQIGKVGQNRFENRQSR